MKYFYINNSLCTDCVHCIDLCPTSAIYHEDGKKYIDHGKCTACGTCLKACDNDAVEVEDIEHIIKRMEKANVYLSNIRRLEKELSDLNARLDTAEDNIDGIIRHLPVAALVAGSDGRILTANRIFIELLNIDPLSLEDMPENLAGQSIRSFF